MKRLNRLAWLTSPLGGSPEGQRNPGRLGIIQEVNIKGAGVSKPSSYAEK